MAQQNVDAEVLAEIVAEIRKLCYYKHCMSHNDSYFTEPAGLAKSTVFQMERLVDKIEQNSPPTESKS